MLLLDSMGKERVRLEGYLPNGECAGWPGSTVAEGEEPGAGLNTKSCTVPFSLSVCGLPLALSSSFTTGVQLLDLCGGRAMGSCQCRRMATNRSPKQSTAPAIAAAAAGTCSILPSTTTAAPINAATA